MAVNTAPNWLLTQRLLAHMHTAAGRTHLDRIAPGWSAELTTQDLARAFASSDRLLIAARVLWARAQGMDETSAEFQQFQSSLARQLEDESPAP